MSNSEANTESKTVYGIKFSCIPTEWESEKLSTSTQFKLVGDFSKCIEIQKIKQMMAYKFQRKFLDVIVSNLSHPWQSDPLANEAFETLKPGQFWFKLHIFDLSSGVFSCYVRGYERRGLLRLEIDEGLYGMWDGFIDLDSVCYAVERFITFQSRIAIDNPDYPMHQLLPGTFKVHRRFKEHRPPGCMDVYIPYTWTYEYQSPLTCMRPRPFRSPYTNELLVHPYFMSLESEEMISPA